MYYKIEKVVYNYPFQSGSYSIILLFSTNFAIWEIMDFLVNLVKSFSVIKIISH